MLGAPDNPAQVRPEENLVGRLQSGQVDVGFFYSTETSDLQIPAIPLPPEVALSAVYTVTVLRDAADPAAAAKFVNFLLGAPGQAVMKQHGLGRRFADRQRLTRPPCRPPSTCTKAASGK